MTLHISEFDRREEEAAGRVIDVLTEPDRVQPAVAVGATSAASAAFHFPIVRFVAREDCHLAFGYDPVATTQSEFWPAGMVEVRFLDPGTRIAVIAAA